MDDQTYHDASPVAFPLPCTSEELAQAAKLIRSVRKQQPVGHNLAFQGLTSHLKSP